MPESTSQKISQLSSNTGSTLLTAFRLMHRHKYCFTACTNVDSPPLVVLWKRTVPVVNTCMCCCSTPFTVRRASSFERIEYDFMSRSLSELSGFIVNLQSARSTRKASFTSRSGASIGNDASSFSPASSECRLSSICSVTGSALVLVSVGSPCASSSGMRLNTAPTI